MARLDSDRRVEERLARRDHSPAHARDRWRDHPADRSAARPWSSAELNAAIDDDDEDADLLGDDVAEAPPEQPDPPGHSLSSLRSLPRVPGQRRAFGRRQLLVVAMVVAVGLLVAGWAVLRARPVALASPIGEPTSAPSTASTDASASPSPAGSTASASQSTPSSPGVGQPASAGATSGAPPSAAPTTTVIEVHVLGAVRRPGVVRLALGARVNDAIRSAGGLTRAATPGRLNLAQPLGDGQQLYLAGGHGTSQLRDPTPTEGGPSSGTTGGSAGGSTGESSGSGGTAGSSATGSAGASSAAKIDLNQATEADLDSLPGIGPVTAGKIIAWRTEHGRFSKVEELEEVDGIGPKTFADLAGRVKV